MVKKAANPGLETNLQKEFAKRIRIISGIDDAELGFAVKNNLIKWWELKAWQESKQAKK